MCDFLKCQFSHVSSNRLLEQMQIHISCMCVIFSNVSFHMCSQIAFLNRCKVTIVACERFSEMLFYTCPLKSPAWTVTLVACAIFLNVSVHMSLQIACLNICAIFLNYDFQIACLNRCKVTLVACERFSEMFVFTCLLTSPAWKDAKSH